VKVKFAGKMSVVIVDGDGMMNAVGLIQKLGGNITELLANLEPVM
jgi:hypothetical protein